MIASDLLDVRVLDHAGTPVGWTVDLRLVLDGPPDGMLARPRLHGLVVSPRTRTSFLGFERTTASSPWPVAQLLKAWHRGTFLAHWDDVERVPTPEERRDPQRLAAIVLRAGYVRYDPRL
ncbi:PRC-barrel domain-containing protein [Xylanimonas sp. McL0601]|uniref:PRC-barrel domain-containing protein n=1 Tax=Xylanimonas sp. McL0601 TaxID=3414739 RepID=UPI003CEF9329